MKKIYWLAVGIMLAAILLAYTVYKSKFEALEETQQVRRASESSTDAPPQPPNFAPKVKPRQTAPSAAVKPVEFSPRVREFLQKEVARIGQTTQNPEIDRQRLAQFAQLLDRDELNSLAIAALSEQGSADQRFMAAYLMAESGAEDAIPGLVDIALRGLPQGIPAQAQSFERAMRGQAVEGLGRQRNQAAARAAARKIAAESSDPFVVDRAQRVLNQLDGGKSPEAQDREALEKILRRK